MSKILRYLAILVFIFFEVYAGIRLLTAPVDFTNSAIVVFGIATLIVGAVMLFYALTWRSESLPFRLGLVLAVVNILLGIICIAFTDKVIASFPVFAVIFGVIMFFTGIDKLGNYFIMKSKGLPHHWIWMVAAVLTIILGVVVIMNPFTTIDVALTYSGYFLIFSGIVDLFAFIFSFFF
jgi:uncharacterized membrane protein HdeD (DUF308 family)